MTVLTWRCISGALIVAALSILYATGLRPRMPACLDEWRLLVGIWLGSTIISGVILTAVARVFGGNEATVSATLQDWFMEWPVIPAALFFLLGHITWPVWKR